MKERSLVITFPPFLMLRKKVFSGVIKEIERKKVTALFIGLVLLTSILLVSETTIAEPGDVYCDVYGYVHDTETHEPIEGVNITIKELEGLDLATDSNGYYEIKLMGAEEGYYTISADKGGYLHQEKEVYLSSGDDAKRVDFRLTPEGATPPETGTSLSGRVFDSNTNAPIHYARIKVFYDYDPGAQLTGALSNETGYYLTEDLPPTNHYMLRAYAEGYFGYVNGFQMRDKNITLDIILDPHPPETSTIKGNIYDNDTKTLIDEPNEIAVKYSEEDTSSHYIMAESALINKVEGENGSYEIMMFEGRNFDVRIDAGEDYEDYIGHRGYIDLQPDETITYDVYLDPYPESVNARVRGHIIDEESQQPVEDMDVRLSYRITPYDGMEIAYRTDSSGYFEIHLGDFPGAISNYTLCAGGHFCRYYYNSTEFELTDGEERWENMTIEPTPEETSEIHGYVLDGRTNQPIRDFSIRITEKGTGKRYWNSTVVEGSDDGHYEIDVYPGEFYLRVTLTGPITMTTRIEYVTEVTVDGGGSINVSLHLREEACVAEQVNTIWLSDWNNVSIIQNSTLSTEQSRHIRYLIDTRYGNNDGRIDIDEIPFFCEYFEEEGREFLDDYWYWGIGWWLGLHVDDMYFYTILDSEQVDFLNVIGRVMSPKQITITTSKDFKSNDPISEKEKHTLSLRIKYDNVIDVADMKYCVHLPDGYLMSLNDILFDATIAGTSEVEIDPFEHTIDCRWTSFKIERIGDNDDEMPEILDYSRILSTDEGLPIDLSIEVTDNKRIFSVLLFFSYQGIDDDFSLVISMHYTTDNRYQCRIGPFKPGEVRYHFFVLDTTGNANDTAQMITLIIEVNAENDDEGSDHPGTSEMEKSQLFNLILVSVILSIVVISSFLTIRRRYKRRS